MRDASAKTQRVLAAICVFGLSVAAAPVMAGDFEGAYVGIGTAAGLNAPDGLDSEWNVFAGYTLKVTEIVLVGVQIDAIYNRRTIWLTDNGYGGKIGARAGLLVSEDLYAYGRAGIGYTTGGVGSSTWDMGAGLETFVLGDYTARLEFDYVDPFEDGMDSQYNVQLGVAYTF